MRQSTPQPTTVAIAILSTRSFSGIATGPTKHRAVALVLAAWNSHAEQVGLFRTVPLTADDVTVIEGPVGTAFVDLQPAWVLPAGHGAHTDEDHTRDAETVGHDLKDEHGNMLCNDCVAPLFLCRVTGTYHHVDVSAPSCRFVKADVA